MENVCPAAMRVAIERAEKYGIGSVTVMNCGHSGALAYHAAMALEHDMIGMCMTSCPPGVVPTYGAEPRLGTNPIAIAFPGHHEPPIVIDMASLEAPTA